MHPEALSILRISKKIFFQKRIFFSKAAAAAAAAAAAVAAAAAAAAAGAAGGHEWPAGLWAKTLNCCSRILFVIHQTQKDGSGDKKANRSDGKKKNERNA